MKLIAVAILLLFTTLTVLPQQCNRPNMANMKPFVRTSFLYYMDGILKKVNLLLDLKLDSESISRSFFDEAYKLMENGNTTCVNISRSCVEGIMDLVWPYKDLFKRGHNASLDEAALFFQWKMFGMMLDSWGKPGSGIFAGNFKWLGSYQQCKRLQVTKPCHAEIRFLELRITIMKGVEWGFCVPKTCTKDDVGTMLSKFQELSPNKVFFSGWKCEKPMVYTKGNYMTITAIVILFALSVIGACVGSYKNYPSRKENAYKDTSKTDKEIYQEKAQDGLEESEKMKEEESSIILNKKKKKESLWIRFICSISIVNGMKSMTNMDVHPEAVGSINGLRFICHCIVTAGHAYGLLYSKDDGHFYLKVMQRYWFMPIANGPVFINVFFLMSGCLAAYLTMKAVQKGWNLNVKNVLIMYFHRFLRLTPSVGMVIAFQVFVVPLLLRGPKTFAEDSEHPRMAKRCHDHWWTNLLFINNFIPGQRSACISWTWSLATDTQMFICMPFVILLFMYVSKRTSRKLLGPFLITCALCGVCMGVRFYLLYMKNFPGASLHNYSDRQAAEMDYHGVWDNMYCMPYARFSPYLIGVFLGYTLAIQRMNEKLNGLWWWIFAAIGWICTLVFSWYAIYTPFKAFSKRVYTSQEHLQYGTMSTTAAGIGFGTLIYLCHHNMGGVANSFLSWKGWIPIGRISYGAYLFHPIVVQYVYDVQEKNMTLVEAIYPIYLWGIITISYSLAAINYLLIEYPIANIEKILLGR